jgi:hypothetical protein
LHGSYNAAIEVTPCWRVCARTVVGVIVTDETLKRRVVLEDDDYRGARLL